MNLSKITFICDGLALDREVHRSRIDCVVATNYTVQISESSPAGYLAFAAYAKAAMAKRGWASITNIYDTPDGLIIMGRVWGEFDGLISEVEVLIGNPTDPISEANALIDAIYAALEMETT